MAVVVNAAEVLEPAGNLVRMAESQATADEKLHHGAGTLREACEAQSSPVAAAV